MLKTVSVWNCLVTEPACPWENEQIRSKGFKGATPRIAYRAAQGRVTLKWQNNTEMLTKVYLNEISLQCCKNSDQSLGKHTFNPSVTDPYPTLVTMKCLIWVKIEPAFPHACSSPQVQLRLGLSTSESYETWENPDDADAAAFVVQSHVSATPILQRLPE